MSRPWMPLYVADYLADTGHLNTTEHGAYLLLIMHYWQTAGLPNDDKRLASIARTSLEQWYDIRPALLELFKPGWVHPRIDEELAEAERKYQARANAGKKGGKAKAEATKQSSSNAVAMLYQPQPHSSTKKEEAKASSPANEWDREFSDEFWPAYPLKRGKPNALKAYRTARKRADLDAIMAGVRRYAAERHGEDPQYTKHAQGWLNGDGWTDEPKRHHSQAPPNAKSGDAFAAMGNIFRAKGWANEPASVSGNSQDDKRLPAKREEHRGPVVDLRRGSDGDFRPGDWRDSPALSTQRNT